jgi:rSAM/selenodomain-associated transferase 1
MASEPVPIAVLAKAPVAGFAKTRLIPALGAARAAKLQARLIERAVETACVAAVGPVTIWTAPDETHATFQMLHTRRNVALARQPDGDLGARMLAVFKGTEGPALVIGTDCPAMMPAHLRAAADALRGGFDAAICPAEDGGYVLLGLRKPLAAMFAGMAWGTSEVMEETRRRLRYHKLRCQELATLWDVDVPADLSRLRGLGLLDEFSR